MTTREITIKESKGTFFPFKKSTNAKEGYNFTDIAALRKVLGNEKAKILRVIKLEKPTSIYDLAKKLNRNFKSVYEDSKLLERFGFIEFVEEKTKNRRRLTPKIISDTITIHIKI
jgi:predicted transcriptional regulator